MRRSGESIAGRYEVEEKLGQGGQGQMYRALDRESGHQIALKELDLGTAADWKAIELFEREASALRRLDHRAIPDYVDAFHITNDHGFEQFFLVQEFLDGESLQEEIDAGVLMTEKEARQFAGVMLEILDYLQGSSPPMIHRDIKPSNILRLRGERESYALVDFGAVQMVLAATVGGSTVVGTTGFMPPEQLMGRAVPASDLYGLGATLVALLSGKDPGIMLDDEMRIRFEDYLEVSDEFAQFLKGLLEPVVEERVESASRALDLLEGKVWLIGARSPSAEEAGVEEHRPVRPGRDLAVIGATVGIGALSCPFLFCLGASPDEIRLGGSAPDPNTISLILGGIMAALVGFIFMVRR